MVNISKNNIHFNQALETSDLIISDLDGTIANLKVNWDMLKLKLASLAQIDGFSESLFSQGIDNGLFKIKKEVSITRYKQYIRVIEHFEINKMACCELNFNWLKTLNCYQDTKKISIFTANTRKCVAEFFKKKEVTQYLNIHKIFIVAKEDVIHSKPSPEGIYKILNHFSLLNTKAIYIGNSENDFICGEKANVVTFDINQIYG